MDWIVFVVIVGVLVLGWFIWPKTDLNKDGKTDVEDVKAAVGVVNDQITDAVTQAVIKTEETVASVTKKVAEKAEKNVTKKKTVAAGKATGAGTRKKT